MSKNRPKKKKALVAAKPNPAVLKVAGMNSNVSAAGFNAALSAKANPVTRYVDARLELLGVFDCPQEYPIRPATDQDWRIEEAEGFFILHYGDQSAVIVRQDRKPLIGRAGGYALVIAIDCVKMAFLLDEKRELTR